MQLVTAEGSRQQKAKQAGLMQRCHDIGREGTPASHWVLVDFGSVIVHVFTPPERDYYSLEKHWSAARVVVRVQ